MTPNENYTSPTTDGLMVQGRIVKPFEPFTFEPSIADIIAALPKINRYNGHTKFPYSVAQHCILCAGIMEQHEIYAKKPHLLLYTLLHDCAEAYLQDLVRPLKQYVPDSYLLAEDAITEKMMSSFLNYKEMDEVKCSLFQAHMQEVDTRMAVTEMVQLMGVENPLPEYEPYPFKIKEMHWKDVTEEYVRLFTTLLTTLVNQ